MIEPFNVCVSWLYTINIPSPTLPSTLLVVKNGSKILERTSSSIPTPSSEYSIYTLSSDWLKTIFIRPLVTPSNPNLNEFVIRLDITLNIAPG